MRKTFLITSALQRIWSACSNMRPSRLYRENTRIVNDSTQPNARRIILMSLIAMPVHVATIFQFMTSPTGNSPNEAAWHHAIILCHSILLILMLAFYLASVYLRRKNKPGCQIKILHHLVMATIMVAGIAIVAIDQLVNSNITAYLITCLLTGTFFLTRPLCAFIYALSGYILFFFMIGLADAPPAVLLTNRVNGLTSSAIGFAVSAMMWRYNAINFRQKQRISQQQYLLEQKNQELEQMAFYDSLTALPNRRYIDQIIRKEISLIGRDSERQSCLIMLDIDHFKDINDTFGHPAGDAILKQISLLLISCSRQTDLIARLGGEEFIILLPGTTMAGACCAAEKLRAAIEKMPFLVDQQVVQITASFGVARLAVSQDRQHKYYAECDQALYLAKQNGRNRVETAAAL